MKWVSFGILAAIFLVCQTTVVQAMSIRSIWPDWMFILAVHYALWGPWPDAAIAAWLLGLIVDLQSASPTPIGLHAFCYGGAAWVIIRIRQTVFRDHPATHVIVTLMFTLAVQVVVRGYYRWRLSDTVSDGIWMPAFLVAVYTAAWAPLLLGAMLKLRRWTGLGPGPRYASR